MGRPESTKNVISSCIGPTSKCIKGSWWDSGWNRAPDFPIPLQRSWVEGLLSPLLIRDILFWSGPSFHICNTYLVLPLFRFWDFFGLAFLSSLGGLGNVDLGPLPEGLDSLNWVSEAWDLLQFLAPWKPHLVVHGFGATCWKVDNISFAFYFCFSLSLLTYTFWASLRSSLRGRFSQSSNFYNFFDMSGQLLVTKWIFNLFCPRGSSKFRPVYCFICSFSLSRNLLGPLSFSRCISNALESFWVQGMDSLIPFIIIFLRSCMFSRWAALFLSHQESWAGNFGSAVGRFWPGGCSHSQIAIAALQIMLLSSPEKRMPRIDICSTQVFNCGPKNWSTWSATS